MIKTTVKSLSLAISLLPLIAVAESQITIKAAAEYKQFLQDPLNSQLENSQWSFFIEPELYYSWNDDSDSITFKPFYRWDEHDKERTHGDIRELMWLHVGEDWELRTGIGIVYWGQAESQHLVDVINQTDFVEALDGEDKLGQPMVNLTLIREWGNLDVFVLPGFRERTFSSIEGRPGLPLPIKQDDAIYESSAEQHHLDWAIRWSHTIEDWDIGLSYFDGTSRDPLLAPSNNQLNSLTPIYNQMTQVGVDLLMVDDAWLYKFEGIYRDTNHQTNYLATVTGFEYTTVGIFESVWDLGWLMEYQYDTNEQINQNSEHHALMVGSRLALNDVNGTEILIGVVQNLKESSSKSGFIEASSRINDNWKWRLDAWFFTADKPVDINYQLRRDDYIQASLEYYF